MALGRTDALAALDAAAKAADEADEAYHEARHAYYASVADACPSPTDIKPWWAPEHIEAENAHADSGIKALSVDSDGDNIRIQFWAERCGDGEPVATTTMPAVDWLGLIAQVQRVPLMPRPHMPDRWKAGA